MKLGGNTKKCFTPKKKGLPSAAIMFPTHYGFSLTLAKLKQWLEKQLHVQAGITHNYEAVPHKFPIFINFKVYILACEASLPVLNLKVSWDMLQHPANDKWVSIMKGQVFALH